MLFLLANAALVIIHMLQNKIVIGGINIQHQCLFVFQRNHLLPQEIKLKVLCSSNNLILLLQHYKQLDIQSLVLSQAKVFAPTHMFQTFSNLETKRDMTEKHICFFYLIY